MLVWSTGSGLVCLLLDRCSLDHEEKSKLSFSAGLSADRNGDR